MKPKLKKWRSLNRPKQIAFGIVALGVLALSLISRESPSTKALSPDRCLSRPYEVLAQVGHYQVIQEVKESHGHHHQEILVSVVDGICSRLNVALDGMDYPFARYIDTEVAIQLNQQLWQRTIEAQGGKAVFEKQFADFANQPSFQQSRNEKPQPPEVIYMPFDKFEALKRLEVKLPSNVQPANEPKFSEHRRPESRKPATQ